MSRIEEALRKVSRRRQSPLESAEDSPQSSERKSKSSYTPAGLPEKQFEQLLNVAPIKIDNLLLAAARDDKTEVVEEYNKLRSAVIALTKGEEFSNTLMITSTISEEGKSMTALNLAMSLAKEHDHTVLLVDTDLRRPSIHRFLGLNPEFGLVHCLRDNLPIEKALIKTGIGKLVILPAGEAVKDPVDMLSSNRMKEIIRELKERYAERYVIFDTPPVLPFADAGVLAASIDATLFVVREGRAQRDEVLNALAEFKDHNVLGIVYNDARTFFKKTNYYYY